MDEVRKVVREEREKERKEMEEVIEVRKGIERELLNLMMRVVVVKDVMSVYEEGAGESIEYWLLKEMDEILVKKVDLNKW